ncbi:hypothetical protein B9Z19DRAFT_1070570 [Tuber borchii]|uniref:Uncharacterized protein n=1 Tax=Tuber borchii TaxID=42251 RepID=A0A2T7A966_TUBBO|nr:hypothetical protein B9Z19DRAFT_1070570 [Tuber borchii]
MNEPVRSPSNEQAAYISPIGLCLGWGWGCGGAGVGSKIGLFRTVAGLPRQASFFWYLEILTAEVTVTVIRRRKQKGVRAVIEAEGRLLASWN